jgi:hypothetical protein
MATRKRVKSRSRRTARKPGRKSKKSKKCRRGMRKGTKSCKRKPGPKKGSRKRKSRKKRTYKMFKRTQSITPENTIIKMSKENTNARQKLFNQILVEGLKKFYRSLKIEITDEKLNKVLEQIQNYKNKRNFFEAFQEKYNQDLRTFIPDQNQINDFKKKIIEWDDPENTRNGKDVKNRWYRIKHVDRPNLLLADTDGCRGLKDWNPSWQAPFGVGKKNKKHDEDLYNSCLNHRKLREKEKLKEEIKKIQTQTIKNKIESDTEIKDNFVKQIPELEKEIKKEKVKEITIAIKTLRGKKPSNKNSKKIKKLEEELKRLEAPSSSR